LIVNPTVPFALPLCPDATTIQFASLAAFHAQPVNVETSNDSRPPSDAIESSVRLKLYRQGAAAWLS
jgi:hypothetical protein